MINPPAMISTSGGAPDVGDVAGPTSEGIPTMDPAFWHRVMELAPWTAPLVVLAGLYILIEIKVWAPNRAAHWKYQAEERQKDREAKKAEIDAHRAIASSQATTAESLREALGTAQAMQSEGKAMLRMMIEAKEQDGRHT